MSAKFWTKILTEVRDTSKGNYGKWANEMRSQAFLTESNYRDDVYGSIQEWFDRPKTRLPRSKWNSRSNKKIDNHVNKHLNTFMKELQGYCKQKKGVSARPVSMGGVGSFRVTFPPTKLDPSNVHEAYRTKRKELLGKMGNSILNSIRTDRGIYLGRHVRVNKGGSGTVYPRRAPGRAFKKSSQLQTQSGLQDSLHGDLEQNHRKETTVAAYGARARVQKGGNVAGGAMKEWAEKVDNTDIIDFVQASRAFQQNLLDAIDLEFGFDIRQNSPIDGRALGDKYLMYYTQRGTAKQNAEMKRLKADNPQVFDRIIDKAVKAVRLDMSDLFNSKGFAAGIEGSPKLKERGKRAVTVQVVSNLKKATKGNRNVKVTSNEKKPTKGTKKKTPLVKATKGKGTKKNTSKPRAKKKAPIGVAAGGTARGKGAMTGRGSGQSPIALMTLINKVLPQELMKNMTGVYPRGLEHRTGRFGSSAEVTQVIPFPRMVEVRYTYMKDPYEVFEPGSGNPLASPGRDPRKIIGETIREIAQEMMGTKFGLVRTKRV